MYDWFQYSVVRVWEQPVDQLLACGLTVLPLAPVSRVETERVPELLLAISERLARESSPDQAATLWNAIRILMGLRFEKDQVDTIIGGVSAMLFGIRGIEESSVYQGILRQGETKGRIEGAVDDAKKILLRHGGKKLGPPSERIETEIAALDNLNLLHDLIDRVFDVSTWDELMASLDP